MSSVQYMCLIIQVINQTLVSESKIKNISTNGFICSFYLRVSFVCQYNTMDMKIIKKETE